jgi:Zn-dependent protease/CBS domain-containing protein
LSGSYRIARLFGIGVYVHWTFGILLAWIVYQHVQQGDRPLEVAWGVGFVLALFGCVVLHEFGHALTARRYGVNTRDITILPIGGLARLERMPEAPMQEFWVAVAGPAVNLVIAGLLFGVLYLNGQVKLRLDVDLIKGDFLLNLVAVNVLLVLFNLLPAFPMDGGRVLRSLLSLAIDRMWATKIAVWIGQAMAGLFAAWGIYSGHWILVVIALFVVLAGQAEVRGAQMRLVFQNARVRDAMASSYRTLTRRDALRTAADVMNSGRQSDFPVSDGQEIVGLLLQRDIVRALESDVPLDSPVESLITDACPSVDQDEPLERVAMHMLANRLSAVLATDRENEVVGLLSTHQVSQWAKAHSAGAHSSEPTSTDAL